MSDDRKARSIQIYDLPPDYDVKVIKETFSVAGSIESVKQFPNDVIITFSSPSEKTVSLMYNNFPTQKFTIKIKDVVTFDLDPYVSTPKSDTYKPLTPIHLDSTPQLSFDDYKQKVSSPKPDQPLKTSLTGSGIRDTKPVTEYQNIGSVGNSWNTYNTDTKESKSPVKIPETKTQSVRINDPKTITARPPETTTQARLVEVNSRLGKTNLESREVLPNDDSFLLVYNDKYLMYFTALWAVWTFICALRSNQKY